MTSVYLGATYSLGPWLRDMVVPRLHEGGYEVTANWVLNWQQGNAMGIGELNELPPAAIAARNECYQDIRQAEAVVFFTDQPSSTGGYDTEFGFADGLGKYIYIVGQPRNIFQCSHSFSYYPNTEAFLQAWSC